MVVNNRSTDEMVAMHCRSLMLLLMLMLILKLLMLILMLLIIWPILLLLILVLLLLMPFLNANYKTHNLFAAFQRRYWLRTPSCFSLGNHSTAEFCAVFHFPFCMRLISSSIFQISFWYSKVKISKSSNGWWWGRWRKQQYWYIDQYWFFDQYWYFYQCWLFINIDFFINFNWFFHQFFSILNLIYLSIIDKNINTCPSLFP